MSSRNEGVETTDTRCAVIRLEIEMFLGLRYLLVSFFAYLY